MMSDESELIYVRRKLQYIFVVIEMYLEGYFNFLIRLSRKTLLLVHTSNFW